MVAEYERNEGMDPSLLIALIARLPDTSMTSAIATGGRDNWRAHFGWGADRHLAANTYDAVNLGTLASGHWKKAPKFDPYPRPLDVKKTEPGKAKPVSYAWLMAKAQEYTPTSK